MTTTVFKLFKKLNKFTCLLYSMQAECSSVNDLRYEQFRLKKGEVHSAQLPPCEDSLMEHTKRANYQAAVWKHCIVQNPSIPKPEGHGWQFNKGLMTPKWISGAPAPNSILDFLSCDCKKDCNSQKCSCISNKLKCTPMCKLQTCSNMSTADGGSDIISEQDSDSDED